MANYLILLKILSTTIFDDTTLADITMFVIPACS